MSRALTRANSRVDKYLTPHFRGVSEVFMVATPDLMKGGCLFRWNALRGNERLTAETAISVDTGSRELSSRTNITSST